MQILLKSVNETERGLIEEAKMRDLLEKLQNLNIIAKVVTNEMEKRETIDVKKWC